MLESSGFCFWNQEFTEKTENDTFSSLYFRNANANSALAVKGPEGLFFSLLFLFLTFPSEDKVRKYLFTFKLSVSLRGVSIFYKVTGFKPCLLYWNNEHRSPLHHAVHSGVFLPRGSRRSRPLYQPPLILLKLSFLSQLNPCHPQPPLPKTREAFSGRDCKFICVLVADVEPSASSKSTNVFSGGTLALMSWPLWPEDMETLCPSVPLHMRQAIAFYCNILLPIAIWPQPVGVMRIHSLSTCCLSLLPTCLVSLFGCLSFVLHNTTSFYVCHFCSLTTPLSSSFFMVLAAQQLQTWRYPTPYHCDAWPPGSPLGLPPRRHDVTEAAAALRLISCLLMVKDSTFHTVSA